MLFKRFIFWLWSWFWNRIYRRGACPNNNFLPVYTPEENILGLNKDNQTPIRFSHLILSLWFLVFCIPLMFFTKFNQKAHVIPNKTTHTIKDLIWNNGLTNTVGI